MAREIDLHPRGHADQVRPRLRRGRGLGAATARRDAGAAGDRPAHPARRPRLRVAGAARGSRSSIYDRSRVEPTLDSLQEAADFALTADVDGFVSVGGGSSIDTAKVANLIVSHPAPVMDYVNAPVGGGVAVPGPLKPHLAIPTTCGTGSEATTVAVLDIPEKRVKTGISHRYLRPSQAIVDPSLATSLPAGGRGLGGAGRHLPRGRVLPLPALHGARAACFPGRAPALPGRQPGGGRVVVEGAGVRRALPAAGGGDG